MRRTHLKTEQFKDIHGYEGLYQISDRGNVRRLVYINNRIKIERTNYLTPTDNGNGYLIVNLYKDGKRKSKYIHRLVAEAFLEKPQGENYVNHIDYNRQNNNADNLEWCTAKQNVMHSSTKMRHEKTICKPTNTGEKYIRDPGDSYRVNRRRMKQDKSFRTLEEAIMFKRQVL